MPPGMSTSLMTTSTPPGAPRGDVALEHLFTRGEAESERCAPSALGAEPNSAERRFVSSSASQGVQNISAATAKFND